MDDGEPSLAIKRNSYQILFCRTIFAAFCHQTGKEGVTCICRYADMSLVNSYQYSPCAGTSLFVVAILNLIPYDTLPSPQHNANSRSRKLPFATADSPLHFELSDGTNDTGSPPSMPLTRPVPALSLPFPLSIPPQPRFSEKILRPKSHWRLRSLFNAGCHDAIRHQPRAGIQLGAKHAVVQLSTSSFLCPGFRTLNMCQMPPALFSSTLCDSSSRWSTMEKGTPKSLEVGPRRPLRLHRAVPGKILSD